MPTLNFLIALIIGFIIGFLVELLMEVLYFRRHRRQVRDDRITQLEADLVARNEQLAQAQRDLEVRDVRISDLEGRLARGQERLNALQRDAALQRQRAQAAAEAADLEPGDQGDTPDAGHPGVSTIDDREAASPTPDAAGSDVATVGDPAEEDLLETPAESAEVNDAWTEAEAASKPASWMD